MTDASKHDPGCIFCAALASADREPLIVWRGRLTFILLNKFPYNNGHLMVVPNRHVGRLADLERDEATEFFALVQAAERTLEGVYQPHGLNLGVNLGKAAGAGVLDHLHMHVVPRWHGDTNFMSVVGETRVLPEELPATAQRLKTALTGILG